mgnify:CR=1 FL=1
MSRKMFNLHKAVDIGAEPIIDKCIEKGEDLFSVDSEGNNILHKTFNMRIANTVIEVSDIMEELMKDNKE